MHSTTVNLLTATLGAMLWGLFPVLARFIQTREPGRPSTVALIASISVVNTALVSVFAMRTKSCTTAGPKLCTTAGPKLCTTAGPPLCTSTRLKVATAYGMLCCARMLSNMYSTRLTSALNVQMTAMLVPFVTAAMSRVCLRENLDPLLLPTLVLTLAGCVLILAGQGAFGGPARRFGATDAAGISVQFGSVVCSAWIKIYWKNTEGVLDKNELLLSQFAVAAAVTAPYAVAFDRASLVALLRMDVAGWMCFWTLAVPIFIFGNILLMIATRALGAANATAPNSTRLLAATLGSWALLGERVESPLEWVGISLVVGTLTSFALAQTRRGMRAAMRTAQPMPHADDAVQLASQSTYDRFGRS